MKYDLSKLNPLGKLSSEFNFWRKLQDMLKKYAAELCVIVILMESIKFFTIIVLFITTLVKEGIEGLKAVIIMSCCTGYLNYRKIKRRTRRAESHGDELVIMSDIGERRPLQDD